MKFRKVVFGIAFLAVFLFASISPAQNEIRDLSQVNRSLIGKEITVVARVLEFRASWSERAPNIITVSDGSRMLEVVYWDDFVEKVPAECKQQGVTVKAHGTLDEYREKLQLEMNKDKGEITLVGEAKAAPVSGEGNVVLDIIFDENL